MNDGREFVLTPDGLISAAELDRSRPPFDRGYFDDGRGWSNYATGYDSAAVHDQMNPLAEALLAWFRPAHCVEFGCAKGVLVQCLRERGVRAEGYDVSEYAVSAADPFVKPYLRVGDVTSVNRFSFPIADLVISMEMLEHIPQDLVPAALKTLRLACGKWAFFTIHLRDEMKDGPEVLTVDLNDLTHRTLALREWWDARLDEAGFVRAPATENMVLAHPYILKHGWEPFVRCVGTP